MPASEARARSMRAHPSPIERQAASIPRSRPWSAGCREPWDRGPESGLRAGTGSASTREPEVDRARARIGPARRDDLGTRVEVDALGTVHVDVAEQRGLPAPERVVRDGHRDRHVDADHAHLDVELELPGGAAI